MTTPDDKFLMMPVKSSSDAKALGSAIAHYISEGTTVQLRAVGAGAVSQAVKAVAISTRWTAPQGIRVAMIPGFKDIEGSSGGTISAITFSIILI